MGASFFDGTIKCDDCGRFMRLDDGASTAAMYDMVGMQMSHEHFRCAGCTELLGPVQSNAKPADGNLSAYQRVY